MSRCDLKWVGGLVGCAIGVLAVAMLGERMMLDPAEVSGAAVDTCWDCKDMKCDFCPRPNACREVSGYCEETVRNLSQYCAPRANGQWENCKWRVDPAGACVTRLVNPCTPEHIVCHTPVSGCGPMGTCIPEGVCIP